jgi:2-polyprenyl-3-methyl-5-hydroxy-6-metoxy-1,4-benzoquinol methylase
MKLLSQYSEAIQKYANSTNSSGEIHPEDNIFHFVMNHPGFIEKESAVKYYFENGLNSVELLKGLISDVCRLDLNNISLLEFASGHGCLTRHLSKIIHAKSITSCDIHEEAIEFLHRNFKVNVLLSQTNPDDLLVSNKFDVVFALSFFSHLPKRTFKSWMQKLFSMVADDGFLIFTTHGLISIKEHMIDIKLDNEGFFFSGHSEQGDLKTSDYGMTVSLPEFVLKMSFSIPNCDLYNFQSGYWWKHQDLYVFKKTSKK